MTTAAVVVALAMMPTALADSTPVGPLPRPAVTTVTTQKGSLVAVSLPSRPAGTGLVWRVARPVDTRVLRQVREADVGRPWCSSSGSWGPGARRSTSP
jgi:hypothetical protein